MKALTYYSAVSGEVKQALQRTGPRPPARCPVRTQTKVARLLKMGGVRRIFQALRGDSSAAPAPGDRSPRIPGRRIWHRLPACAYARHAMAQAKGNRLRAAGLLGVDIRTLR